MRDIITVGTIWNPQIAVAIFDEVCKAMDIKPRVF